MSPDVALPVRPAWPRLGSCGLDQPCNPFHVAERVANASCHRWRDAKALVDAAEVIPDELQRQRSYRLPTAKPIGAMGTMRPGVKADQI